MSIITLGIALGAVAYVALVALRCFFRVEEGHRALLTSFSALVSDDKGRPRSFGPGLHRKLPWHRVHPVSVMEQNLDLGADEADRVAMAEDGTVLRFDSVLRYTPDPAQLERYVFGMRRPREHIAGLFASLLRNEIANIRTAGGTTVLGRGRGEHTDRIQRLERGEREPETPAGSYAAVRRERHQLNGRIAEFCRSRLGDRYGIEFRAVDLTDMLPPDELADALNAVMRARSEADALFARAEADCRQRVLSAERGVDIARESASAVEAEVRKLGSYLAALSRAGTLDLYVRRRRAEVLSESRAVFVRRAQ